MIGLHASPFPTFQPGERILSEKRYVRAVWVKSPPTRRLSMPLPPLVDIGLYVTNRRALLVALVLFRLARQEFSQWIVPTGSPDDDTIIDVNVGRTRLLGPYVEVVSENAVRSWFRSPRMIIRYYVKSPEALAEEFLRCRTES